MALPHPVFAQCARLESDAYLRDTYVGMSHGMFPFCEQPGPHGPCAGPAAAVQEEPGTQMLLFRRSTAPGEKDKSQRLADAAESLQSCPDVAWYNSVIGATNASPLHIRPGTLAVAWSIPRHDVATHMRLVPALLRWTRWDRDAPWQLLRSALATEAQAMVRVPSHPRHIRTAQVVDFIGMQSMAIGEPAPVVATLCQTVLQLYSSGNAQVRWNPQTGEVEDVALHVNV